MAAAKIWIRQLEHRSKNGPTKEARDRAHADLERIAKKDGDRR